MPFQEPLPPAYADATDADLAARIAAAKQTLGSRVVLLGHHYQRDEVVAFADFTGDSLKLSQIAAAQTQAEYIIFCGVHFMAESADILTSDRQQVILPDLTAGCSMADMADIDQLEDVWPVLTQHCGEVIPITYVNSTAAIKAFVGRHGGACCTSSNAKLVLEWALQGARPGSTTGPRVLFLPDQHLGRNTAYALGWPLESMVTYNPDQPFGGVPLDQLSAARFILWAGHCAVHQLFRPEQADALRKRPEPWKLIVHPECMWELCQKSDYVGSTEYIIKTITESAPGTYWSVGTEIHLVGRLMKTLRDRTIAPLGGPQCSCSTMYRIDLKHLCWTLENLVAGRVVNRIIVDAETKHWSKVALERMLALRPTQPVSAR